MVGVEPTLQKKKKKYTRARKWDGRTNIIIFFFVFYQLNYMVLKVTCLQRQNKK